MYTLRALEPVKTAHLFAPLSNELISLLQSLNESDWLRPTVCKDWTVKDIVAHILDGDMRRLSLHRDQWSLGTSTPQIDSYRSLVNFFNQLNATWVESSKRLSPRVLIELLDIYSPQVSYFFGSLDPNGEAKWSVAWAGEETSRNWMDIARDYTEKWHHQQQIRDAVHAPELYSENLFAPVLETFMLVMPHAYRELNADEGTTIQFSITQGVQLNWTLRRERDQWVLWSGASERRNALVELSGDTFWRLVTNQLSPEVAQSRVRISGDESLLTPLWDARSVMV